MNNATVSTRAARRILASPRRQRVLRVLAPLASITLDALARQVATREQPAPTGGHVERVLTSLYRVHVPLLSDRGVVDVRGEYVRPTWLVSALVAALDRDEHTTRRGGSDV